MCGLLKKFRRKKPTLTLPTWKDQGYGDPKVTLPTYAALYAKENRK